MKTFKIKNFVLIALIALCFFCINLYSVDNNDDGIKSYASFTMSPSITKEVNSASNAQYTPEEAGNIPFSLFTSKKELSGSSYTIVDYFPDSFTYSTQGQGVTAIHNYTIDEDSIPYIMLSSNSDDHVSSYNTTVYFKFNDQSFKSATALDQTTISKEPGYLTVEAFVNDIQITVSPDTTSASTDDACIVFAVNLKDPAVEDAKCPDTINGEKLGNYNNGAQNDVSFRTGLYTFKISYSFQDVYGTTVSNKCVFTYKFYVLDLAAYDTDTVPTLTFTNTDTYTVEQQGGTGTNPSCEIYNYNYIEQPYVEFDATKFAMNFVYTTGYTNYAMQYKSFNYNPGCSPSEVMQKAEGVETGKVIIKLKNPDPNAIELTYPISTYKKVVNSTIVPYYAKFDLADFENNFLVKHNINSTNLGEYNFNLDFLIQNETSYTVFDNSMLNIESSIIKQKLVMFGYKLKYYNQTSKQNLELKNDVTHTNFIAYNGLTSNNAGVSFTSSKPSGVSTENNGFLVNIPQYIAITDQAPLRFDYYGNLKESYTTPFATIDYKSPNAEESILNAFTSATDITTLGDNIKTVNGGNDLSLTYIQGSSISNDGIRIMKLYYQIKVDFENVENTQVIEGCQYVVFEINNSIHNLYIQAVDFEDSSKQRLSTTYDFKEYTNKNVRVNIEDRPNTFFAPIQITYNYYSSFNTTDYYSSGNLIYKTDGANKVSYKINNKNYNYFVTDNNNNFTFDSSNSGAYKITIKSTATNIPSTYDFIIDSEEFSGISVNKATINNGNYVIDSEISSSIFNGDNTTLGDKNLLSMNAYITSSAFTLGWNNKRSGAKSTVYFYYMSASDDASIDNSMFKKGSTPKYFVTNGVYLDAPGGADTDYKNYKDTPNYAKQVLAENSYFNLDGLYFFFIHDEAGNFFTRTVLIDSSINSILQGYWSNKEEASTWVNTYNPDTNPANYVNRTTTIYFGDYKVLKLPDLSQTKTASFENTSFVRAYKENTPGHYELVEKPKISFDLYRDVLTKYTKLIDNIDSTPIIGSANKGYYITLENTSVQYEREYEERDANGNFIVDANGGSIVKVDKNFITEIYKATIYDIGDTSSYGFNDEGQYYFTVTNKNQKVAVKDICMNFDIVQGTFWAYKQSSTNPTERLIRKNNGTNLDVLKFVFNNVSDKTAQYYKVSSLTYKHFAFVLDDSSPDSDKSSYPFSNVISKQGSLPLTNLSADGLQTIVDNINLNASNKTIPGKYILTRTYVGGTHNYDKASGQYVEAPGKIGGKYYYDIESGEYVDLFSKDVLVRNYTVYVDRNGIITTEYMTRNDGISNIREVGDNISITLSNGYEDEWNFKEFFLTSSANLALDTNKVPVKINIPLSKYFVLFNVEPTSPDDYMYATQSFANLEIKIEYIANAFSAIKYYTIDGYDINSGMCTSKALQSSSNPLGLLIFSAEGQYIIHINDKTGYSDTSSLEANARNTDPTTYTYSFSITHTSPEAQAETLVYDYLEQKHFVKVLTNEYNNYEFATNIKELDKNNPEIAPNEFIVTWVDPITPYQAKIKQADFAVKYDGQTIRYSIDLNNYNILGLLKEKSSLGEELEIEIDTSEFKTTDATPKNYIKYFKIRYFNDVDTPKVYDHKDYYRFEYFISFNIEFEYIYRLDLSYVADSQTNQDYIDSNGNSFATSYYSLIIDRTKPNTNIDKLLNAETYLTSSGYYTNSTINNFKEENFDAANLNNTPSAFTYAFGVPHNYQLTYNPDETLPYFFVRSYQKYKDEYSSITPDMTQSVYDNDKAYSDYTNKNIPSLYPRFEEYNSDSILSKNPDTWHRINYQSNTPLKDLIAKAISPNSTTSPNGFFEVIERDLAGNYRNFTVYYNEKESIFLNLEIDGFTQKNNIDYLVSTGDDANQDNISANIYFDLTKISTSLGWGSLSVKNSTTNTYFEEDLIYLTPFDDDNYDLTSERLRRINEFMQTEINSKFTFTLSRYNETYNQPALTRHINLNVEGSGKLDAPIIEEVPSQSGNESKYNLILPNYDSKRVLYLEEFTLQKLVANSWQILQAHSFVGKENVKPKIENIEKGVYKAIYKDNFNDNAYSFILYVGEYYIKDFNKEYQFEFQNYYQTTNEYLPAGNNVIYYSGGDIDVTYEENIYKVFLSTNFGPDVLISGDALIEHQSPTLPNCKTFKLSKTNLYNNIAADQSVGGLDFFTLKYVDVTDSSIIQKVINFGIFNALPEINLTNSYGGKVESTLEESDTQIAPSSVNISWGDLINNYLYDDVDNAIKNVVSTLYIRNDRGEYLNGFRISKDQQVIEEGFYKIELKNELLGNFREIYFAISLQEIPLYSITSNGKRIYASPYEKFNLTSDNSYSTNVRLIDKIHDELNNLSFIPNPDKDELSKQFGYITNTFNISDVGVCNLTNVKHFYYTDNASIKYNGNIELNIVEFVFKNGELKQVHMGDKNPENGGMSISNQTPNDVQSDYWTTIFLIYNIKGPIKIEFFALTKVPKTSNLLNKQIQYLNESTNNLVSIDLQNKDSSISTTLTNAEIINSDINIVWNAQPTTTLAWYNRGNVIVLSDKYGVETSYYELDCLPCTTNGNLIDTNVIENFNCLTTTINGSGLHNLIFKDIAGNQHIFAQNAYSPQNYYSLLLIDKVIFNIKYKDKDLNPIDHGVFNDNLDLIIDSQFISYYTDLNMYVTRNGNLYSINPNESNPTLYSFADPGKYIVTISAKHAKSLTPLNSVVYNFTIIPSNSARLAYEFVEILGYEILEVTRNKQNITTLFDTDGDGRVFSVFISPTSGGNGLYTIKLKYGARDDQILTYNFTINDYIPTISSNVKHGETTTGPIVISYNANIIYEQLGECYIKILTYNNDSKTYYSYGVIPIDASKITSNGTSSLEITRSNSYFIQVETKSGNIISSFRVNKTDPLNAMAIIIIVIASIAVIILIIVVVKLRTRMKIK